jgi:hypothetical protein
MTNNVIRGSLGFLIIVIFIGASVLPSISGDIEKITNKSELCNDINKNFLDNPPEEEWNKTFGGTDEDYGYEVLQTSDGGYLIIGRTESYGAGGTDVWLIKTDANGTELWNKTYGGTGNDEARSVSQTTDDGYIIFGSTNSFVVGDNFNVWLIKTDADGNELWNKTLGGIFDYGCYSGTQTTDGGYVIFGNTDSFGTGDHIYDVWLFKTDASGNELWNKTFGGIYSDVSYSGSQTNDGGYIITGFTTSYGAGEYDAWLIKTDANGNELWNKTYGGGDSDFGWSVLQTNDSGYVLTGYTESYGAGEEDAWLIRTDQSGNELWNKTYGGIRFDDCYSFSQTNDGGYVLTGRTYSFSTGYHDVWLIKTDSNGNEEWNETYGGIGHDWGRSVSQTSDSGYIITGWTNYYGAGETDVWLVKVAKECSGNPIVVVDIINGGFRVSADIKNIGNASAFDVEWSIVLEGGLVFLGSHSEGVIPLLALDETKRVRQPVLFCIGKDVLITVTAGSDVKQATASWILGPLVLGVT